MIIGKADRFAFKIFTRALFVMFRDKEGLIVEIDKKLYIVHKGRNKNEEMMLMISTVENFDIQEDYKREGQMMWLGKEEKSNDNREVDKETT